MKVEDFVNIISSDFYTGVPDSQLKALCDYLLKTYGTDSHHHIIAANEGNAVGLAAGYHLATGKAPVVYMQNSGEGNVINPIASLLNDKVYAIPCIFIIGWRGEPGIHDEPQHIFQGEVTLKLLEDMGVEYTVVDTNSCVEDVQKTMGRFKDLLKNGKQVAFVIRKGALEYGEKVQYKNDNELAREEVIENITTISGDDLIISTTGKASRELFEVRERQGQEHLSDFLTVGSMGHCSSIALGVALNQPERKVWCIDGDGAALMHMGALPVIANSHPRNLIHIIINNGSHESVGGQPTVMSNLNFWEIARVCGYPHTACVSSLEELDKELKAAKECDDLTLLEVKCKIGARADLGRPTTTAIENKESFMNNLK